MSTAVVIILIITGLTAAITLVPHRAARKKARLGYKALCPFAPYSTLAIIFAGATVAFIAALL